MQVEPHIPSADIGVQSTPLTLSGAHAASPGKAGKDFWQTLAEGAQAEPGDSETKAEEAGSSTNPAMPGPVLPRQVGDPQRGQASPGLGKREAQAPPTIAETPMPASPSFAMSSELPRSMATNLRKSQQADLPGSDGVAGSARVPKARKSQMEEKNGGAVASQTLLIPGRPDPDSSANHLIPLPPATQPPATPLNISTVAPSLTMVSPSSEDLSQSAGKVSVQRSEEETKVGAPESVMAEPEGTLAAAFKKALPPESAISDLLNDGSAQASAFAPGAPGEGRASGLDKKGDVGGNGAAASVMPRADGTPGTGRSDAALPPSSSQPGPVAASPGTSSDFAEPRPKSTGAMRVMTGAREISAKANATPVSAGESTPGSGVRTVGTVGESAASAHPPVPGDPGGVDATSANPYQKLDQMSANPSAVYSASANRVAVGVHDPSLGWVEIKTQSAGGQVSAEFVTASSQSHASLSAQLPSIAQYLTEREVRLNSLGVEHQPGGGNGERGATPDQGQGSHTHRESTLAMSSSSGSSAAGVREWGSEEIVQERPLSYISVRA